MTNMFSKKYPSSLAIKETQIHTTLRFHLTKRERLSYTKQMKIDTGKRKGQVIITSSTHSATDS